MPQFDQFSFFNQVSGFLIFFFCFYFFVTYFLLPKICYALKFRKKKLFFDTKKQKQINFEKNNIFFFLNNFYTNFYSNFKCFIIQKKLIYKSNEKIKIQKEPIFNFLLNEKINFFLNQKFLLFKKIFNFI